VSHEWIYLYVYADKRRGGTLHRHLRSQKKQRKRYSGYLRRGQIPNRTSIDKRPQIVARMWILRKMISVLGVEPLPAKLKKLELRLHFHVINQFQPTHLFPAHFQERGLTVRIYTLGYQGLSTEMYVQALINAGVGLVLDVRERAWSQRPEFVKSRLQTLLMSSGIEYAHIKAAGNPSANRKTARSAAQCMSRYRNHLAKNSNCLRTLLLSIESASNDGRPACLTCYERHYTDCHRSVLMEELIKLEPASRPIHLEPHITPKPRNGKQLKAVDRSQTPFGSAFMAPAFLPFM
jgi:hypothetical protein